MSIGDPVSGFYRIATVPRSNGLAAYGTHDESTPIAYISEQPQCMCP